MQAPCCPLLPELGIAAEGSRAGDPAPRSLRGVRSSAEWSKEGSPALHPPALLPLLLCPPLSAQDTMTSLVWHLLLYISTFHPLFQLSFKPL